MSAPFERKPLAEVNAAQESKRCAYYPSRREFENATQAIDAMVRDIAAQRPASVSTACAAYAQAHSDRHPFLMRLSIQSQEYIMLRIQREIEGTPLVVDKNPQKFF
jgi:hypothetical protein